MDRKIEKKKITAKQAIGLLALSVLILSAVYAFVLNGSGRRLNEERDKITICITQKGTFQDYFPVIGTVLPSETFYLDVVEGGRVIEKYVEEGAMVKAGTPILRMENAQLTLSTIYNQAQVVQQENNLRSYRLELEQNRLSLQNQLLQIELQIQNQKRIYNTNKALHDKNLISVSEFEQSRDQYEFLLKSKKLTLDSYHLDSLSRNEQIKQLEVSVKQFQKNLKIIDDQFSNLLVRAPIAGQLTALNAEIGKSINVGQNIGQIDNITSYKVRVDIDEHYIGRVHEGQTGDCEVNDRTYKLRVTRVYVQVTSGRFQADMNFTGEPPKELRRGQTMHIRLDLGGQSEAIMINAGPFFQTTGGQWIYVVDKSGKRAEKRQIKIGRQNPRYYEILSGLQPGEKVITSSYENYRDIDQLVLK